VKRRVTFGKTGQITIIIRRRRRKDMLILSTGEA
jgi:hypothetical protein